VFDRAALLCERGESSFEVELRRLLDSVRVELDPPVQADTTSAATGADGDTAGETGAETARGRDRDGVAGSAGDPVAVAVAVQGADGPAVGIADHELADRAASEAVRSDVGRVAGGVGDGAVGRGATEAVRGDAGPVVGGADDRAAADVGAGTVDDGDEARAVEVDGVGERITARAERLDRLVTEGAGHLATARRAQRELARAAADQARALAAFARSRPTSFDRPDGEVGAAAAHTRAARPAVLASVSEWAVDEVMVALGLTSQAAGGLLVDSLRLTEFLPATLDALSEGRASWAHVQVMTDLIAPLPDDVRAVAEQRLLAKAGGRTRTQLRVAARRLVQKLDAAAIARRVTEAIRERRVTVHPGDDGMATLSVVLPAPVARAVQDALRQYADAASIDGDERTRAQRMVDCLVDLVLRPGEHGMSPVQARLTIVAAVQTLLGSDDPGEVDGDLVPAAMVRELAVALGLLPGPPQSDEPAAASTDAPAVARPVGEGVEQEGRRPASVDPRAGHPRAGKSLADESPVGAGTLQALTELLRSRSLLGTSLERRPHLALVDELSGQLVALTDAIGLRRGQALGPPSESTGYRPGRALDRFVRLRDRRCRFPGCRTRPIRCDLDHQVPWPMGRTTHGNLCCLCRHHHRLSHQAPGWRLRGLSDGGLEWTTPGGIVATTHPPGFGTDDDLPLRAGPDGGPVPAASPSPGESRSTAAGVAARTRRPAEAGGSGADESPPF